MTDQEARLREQLLDQAAKSAERADAVGTTAPVEAARAREAEAKAALAFVQAACTLNRGFERRPPR